MTQLSDDVAERIARGIARRMQAHTRSDVYFAAKMGAEIAFADSGMAALADPAAVHVNMLRGAIAKPSPRCIWHLYGRDLLGAMPEEYRSEISEAKGSESV